MSRNSSRVGEDAEKQESSDPFLGRANSFSVEGDAAKFSNTGRVHIRGFSISTPRNIPQKDSHVFAGN